MDSWKLYSQIILKLFHCCYWYLFSHWESWWIFLLKLNWSVFQSLFSAVISRWAHLLLFLSMNIQIFWDYKIESFWFLDMGHNSFNMHLNLTRVDLMPTLSAAWKAKVKFLLCMRYENMLENKEILFLTNQNGLKNVHNNDTTFASNGVYNLTTVI